MVNLVEIEVRVSIGVGRNTGNLQGLIAFLSSAFQKVQVGSVNIYPKPKWFSRLGLIL
jgi:hypothetical protein